MSYQYQHTNETQEHILEELERQKENVIYWQGEAERWKARYLEQLEKYTELNLRIQQLQRNVPSLPIPEPPSPISTETRNEQQEGQRVRKRKVSANTATALEEQERQLAKTPHKKRNIKRCEVVGCEKVAVRGGVCVSHGGFVKRCGIGGCSKYAIQGGVCVSHGAMRKRCKEFGCQNGVVNGGVCTKHGAKRKKCSAQGCGNVVLKYGLCVKHGALNSNKKTTMRAADTNDADSLGEEQHGKPATAAKTAPATTAGETTETAQAAPTATVTNITVIVGEEEQNHFPPVSG